MGLRETIATSMTVVAIGALAPSHGETGYSMTAPDPTVLDLGRLAAITQLPPEVARHKNSMVAIGADVRDAGTRKLIEGQHGSGFTVRVNGSSETVVVTAGHVATSQFLDAYQCAQSEIYYSPHAGPDAHPGEQVLATAAYAEYTGASVAGTDMAIIKVPNERPGASSMPAILLSSQPVEPKKGDIVYFMTYQPTMEGAFRTPISPYNELRTPAAYAGLVANVTDTEIAVIGGSSHSLGTGAPDTHVQRGASGAPGFIDGVPVGIVKGVAPSLSVNIFEEVFGIDIIGDYPGAQLSYMQRLDAQTIAAGASQATADHLC